MAQATAASHIQSEADLTALYQALEDLIDAINECALDDLQRVLVVDFILLESTISSLFREYRTDAGVLRCVPTPAYTDLMAAIRGGQRSCMYLVQRVLCIQAGLCGTSNVVSIEEASA